MQIHELTNTTDLSSTDYVGVDNGTTTRRFDLGALIASIRSRLTNAETGISNLQTSVSDVQGDVADAQSDITGLGTRLDAAESSITSQGTRLTTAESTITDLQNSKVDKTTPLLNFDDTATDPMTDDGALANALRALDILDDVIPSGGGSLYLKKALTELCEKIGVIGTVYTAPWIATSSNASSTQLTDILTIPAGTYILLVTTPPASAENFVISVAGQYAKVFGTGGGSFVTVLTTTATSTTVRSAQSASVTFSYIERGSLKAIRIA